MTNGWIKLHRKILENPITKKPNYLSLWIILLLKANHKEKKIMWNGDVLIVKEGQVLTGRKELSEQSGIPETTIERILSFLEKSGNIGQQKTSKFRLITVINWKEYQADGQQTDNKRTTNGQQTDTNKNDKNDKNEKKNTIDFSIFWESYGKKISRPKCEAKWNKLKLEEQEAILKHIPLYKETKAVKSGYQKHPATYLNNRSWEDEIEEKEVDTSGWSDMKIIETYGVAGLKKYRGNDFKF